MEIPLPPHETGINARLGQWKARVERYLANLKEDRGDIIDLVRELEVMDFAAKDMRRYAEEVFEQPDAAESLYRAFMFAYQLVEETTHGEDIPVDMQAYWVELEESGDMVGKLIDDTQEYMQHRTQIDKLIQDHMPEIDKTGNYYFQSATMATMFVMLVDRELATSS